MCCTHRVESIHVVLSLTPIDSRHQNEPLPRFAIPRRFDVPLCLSCCCDELSKRSPADYDIPAINTVFSLPPGLHDVPAVAAAMGKATEALLQRLGDAEAVCGAWYDNASDLDKQLQQLSLASLLALIQSDKLTARSENSLLMMADAWVLNSPVGKSCGPTQLRHVAEAVRMGQLSATFFHGVVPRLSWVSLSDKEREGLSMYVAYKALSRSEKVTAFVKCSADCPSGPSRWLDRSPRPLPQGMSSPAPLVMKWELTRAELAGALSMPPPLKITRVARSFFYGGFSLQLVLMRDPTSGQWVFGHTVRVRRAGCTEALPMQGVASCTISTRVSDRSAAGGWGAVKRWSGSNSLVCVPHVISLKVPEGASSDGLAPFEPYLVNGKLCVEFTLFACD